MKRPLHQNLQALAETLGVSATTVSRVLSGKAGKFRISPATQQRVIAGARKSGVMVNQIARGLRLRQTHTIGLVIPDISNPFFASLARQVEHSARARGYSVLLADSEEKTASETSAVQLMLSRRVDGLIIAPVGESADSLEAPWSEELPLVLVDRVFPALNASSVTADNHEGARLAVAYFLAHGHERIACVQGLAGTYANQERIRGYRHAMTEAGLTSASDLVAGEDYTIEAGKTAAIDLLTRTPRPTALLALGNLIALGALQACRELGLRIPDDVSLISFDEQPWAALLAPPVTTVSQPIQQMGERAMELLFSQLSSKNDKGIRPERIVLPVALVERESVCRISSDSPCRP